jgi:hypothetical protein
MSTADVARLYEILEKVVEGQKQTDKKISEIDRTQTQMFYVLKGNPLDESDKGILGNINELDKDVLELKDDRKKMKWVVGAIVTVGGVIVTALQFYFLKIHK